MEKIRCPGGEQIPTQQKREEQAGYASARWSEDEEPIYMDARDSDQEERRSFYGLGAKLEIVDREEREKGNLMAREEELMKKKALLLLRIKDNND